MYKDSGVTVEKMKLIFVFAENLDGKNVFAILSFTVMVGDRRYDVIGALANEVLPVGVLWGYGLREELASAGGRKLYQELHELRLIA